MGGDTLPLVYGSERGDTRKPKGPCDDANTGFVAIMNWGNLGDGEHTAVVYDNGVEFDRTPFRVVTSGAKFLTGVTGSGIATLSNGQRATLKWSEETQGFVATAFTAPPGLDSDLCTTKTAKVGDILYDSATWLVTNPCNGETLYIDITTPDVNEFWVRIRSLDFVQDGLQFDSSHFDWFDRNTLDSASETILPGVTKETTVGVEDDTTLNFSQPFKIYYADTLIFEFP